MRSSQPATPAPSWRAARCYWGCTLEWSGRRSERSCPPAANRLSCCANVDCTPRELLGFAHIGAVYARDVLDRGNPSVGLLANVDCTPRELLGFAHIGAVYARDVLDRGNPSVGLLNIGEEEDKGNEAVRAAFELVREAAGFSFVGNVEGRDILSGQVDVVVCDGFVGNVLLKFSETIAHLFEEFLKREVEQEVLQGEGMQRVFKVLDYAEYGGAPLLGVRGVAIICHGQSPARAIKNAIGVAVHAVKAHLSQHIAAEMAGGGAVA